MDIDYLLERMEEALTSGSRVPFSRRALIDEEECLSILEQIREAVPEEIQRARRVNTDRDRMLQEANERARTLLSQAQQDAEELASEHELVRMAEERAAQIRSEALHAADEIRREADQYAYNVLEKLERTLHGNLQLVRRGLSELEQGPGAAYAAEEDLPDELP
jgi:cell division septum initiation protein DivIVA